MHLGSTTEAPPATGTVGILTGGYNNGNDRHFGTEIYPVVSGCTLPPLPGPSEHSNQKTIAFVHKGRVTVCGEYDSDNSSCLMLDVKNQRWEKNLIGKMTANRYLPATVSVENVGTYLLGGRWRRTSDFLASEATEWVVGPDLPFSWPCAVKISPLNLLVIYKDDIREYQVDPADPTNSLGWQPENTWPKLKISRREMFGCALTPDNKVVFAGGYMGSESVVISSSEILDLSTRTTTIGGNMLGRRAYFHLATITLGEMTKLFAIGGHRSEHSVEMFNPEDNSWIQAPSTLEKPRRNYGKVIVPAELVCPI